MAGRVFTVEFTNKAATAAMADFDFFELVPATGKKIEIVAIFIGQETAEGDANEDFIRWAILRWSGGTFTSGGEVATTARPTDSQEPGAASFTAEAFNAVGTVATSSGTLNRLHSDTFNARSGLQMIFPPEMRHSVEGVAQSAMVVRCESTLDATTNFSGTLYVREI
jgi:hypothetical protein